MKFPKDFIWGAAASSYQIEGSPYIQGGGRSIWDMMSRHDGKIANGDHGDIACDHFNRYQDDIDLMAEIGLQSYRFSVSWPRVIPDGVGKINQKGLDFYSHLVDSLLEKNIVPWVTLFHWDFPYELYCKGGWLNRDSADWFAEYTAVVVDKLSDRVGHWCTLNEPQIYIGMGHHRGTHAPGLPMATSEALRAAHHTLLAHGKAVQVIRSRSKCESYVSASHAGDFSIPDTESAMDVDAARQRNFSILEKGFTNNSWFSDPMILGSYPQDGLALYEQDMAEIELDDMDTICQPLDYIGTNVYSGNYVQHNDHNRFEVVHRDGVSYTDMGWPVTPEVMYWAPRFYYERYGLPVIVTENGMANPDQVIDGRVEDNVRIKFLQEYLYHYGRAIEEGIPCPAYMLWSLMDNFEWAEGYAKRFGIIHVNYEDQTRTLKDSAYWYQKAIRDNEVCTEWELAEEQYRAQAS